MSIADRLFARVGEPVTLATRSDIPTPEGGIAETYTPIVSDIPAKIVEIGTQFAGDEQIEEGITHIVTISDRSDADPAEYVLHGERRMRVQRWRLIGPPDIRFRQYMCEEIERADSV